MPIDLKQKIYVAGHRGMVGSAIVRNLVANGYTNIISRGHGELDLTSQAQVVKFFKQEKPDQVYLAAAKVGGIYANNTFPAQFIYENLMIQNNVIHQAFLNGVKKLLFLGSSCIYPKLASQPMEEGALLSGKLEETNEPYAIAKISGIKMCESYNRQYGQSHGIDYRSVMPTNLYGPGDSYHPENSHVIPSLIRKFHEAKVNNLASVVIWGTGAPRREFLYVDDLAEAAVFVMNLDKVFLNNQIQQLHGHINVGFGSDLSIADLAKTIGELIGFDGDILFDPSKSDGVSRKLLNSKLLNLMGWTPKYDLMTGLILSYRDYLNRFST